MPLQEPGPIRLLIAEDEPVARVGLREILVDTGIEVVAEAIDWPQAVQGALAGDIDLVLLDLRMNGEVSFPAIEQIKQAKPDVRVIIFSASDNLADMVRAKDLGADGYLSKTATRDEIIKTIRRAFEGRMAWTREQRRRFKNLLKARSIEPAGVALTPQELRILEKLVAGLTNEEISIEFGISVETVKQHLKHVLAKLGLVDRTQAALWALRNGIG